MDQKSVLARFPKQEEINRDVCILTIVTAEIQNAVSCDEIGGFSLRKHNPC